MGILKNLQAYEMFKRKQIISPNFFFFLKKTNDETNKKGQNTSLNPKKIFPEHSAVKKSK